LDLSKIQFNRFELHNSWFSMSDLIHEAVGMCQFQAQARKLDLRTVMKFEDTLMAFSDRKRIKQILINLIINGIKFTYQGSVTILAEVKERESEEPKGVKSVPPEDKDVCLDRMETCRSSLDLDDSDNESIGDGNDTSSHYLKIDVIDTGVGISEEDQRHIFKIFGKLKKTYHINQ
jgi:signal transduction histidine kinase